jgi:alkylphosphonate utilization operon protein PhnA
MLVPLQIGDLQLTPGRAAPRRRWFEAPPLAILVRLEIWTRKMAVKDSNGTVLNAGDSVTVIKDLKVKGASIPLKRGTVIKNIRLVEDDDEHVEGNSDKIKGLVLKACYLKKA